MHCDGRTKLGRNQTPSNERKTLSNIQTRVLHSNFRNKDDEYGRQGLEASGGERASEREGEMHKEGGGGFPEVARICCGGLGDLISAPLVQQADHGLRAP